MSKWDDMLSEHPLFEILNEINKSISLIESKDNINADAIDEINRINRVTNLIDKKLHAVDPMLINKSIIDNIYRNLPSISSELNNFNSNSNIAHLYNANNQIDSLLAQLSNIPILQESDLQDSYSESLSSFRRSVGQYLHNIENSYQQLSDKMKDSDSKLEKLITTIDNQNLRLDTAISQYQKQFSASEEKRRDLYSEEKEKYSNGFDKLLESQESMFKEKNQELDIKINEIIDKKEGLVQQLLKFIEDKKDEAIDLLHIIANTGMSGAFQKVANQSMKAKYIWQLLTVSSIIGLIIFAIIAFIATSKTDFSLGKFGARSFVAFSFGILAAYSAKQADKNSQVEKRNRQLELELASIEPYLSKLPEEMKHELKRLLAEKWFGNSDPLIQSTKGKDQITIEKFTGSIVDLLKMVLENLSSK